MNLSIASRILLIALLPACLATVILSAYHALERAIQIEDLEIKGILLIGENIAKASEFGIATENVDFLETTASTMLRYQSVRRLSFSSLSNNELLVIHNDKSSVPPIGLLGSIFRPWLTNRPLVEEITIPITRTHLVRFSDPLLDDSALEPDTKTVIGTLHLHFDLSDIWHRQESVILKGLLIMSLVLAGVVIGAIALARAISKPIRQVTNSVQQLSYQQYPDPLPEHLRGELGELYRGVNYLSAELQSFHSKLRESTRIATKDLHTALRVLEQQNLDLRDQRAKAESASQFKSQFLANMSHEIRTPMNTIVGQASLLQHSDLTADQHEQIDLISLAAKDLLRLLDDVLDIARIESGNVQLQIVPTDLERVFMEVNQSVAQQAFDQGIELFVTPVTNERFRYVYCDPLRLKQVLLNLLNNAIKFTHKGHVLLDMDILEHDQDQATYLFTISDTGIGVPDDKIDAMFEAFRQIDMSTTRKYGGTGLGLHISQHLVKLMQGEIDVDSTEGEGTQFNIVLRFSLQPERVDTTQPVNLPVMSYVDFYEPLADRNRELLQSAGASIRTPVGEDLGLPLLVNITNARLQSESPDLPATIESHANRYALLSQISAPLRKQLSELGFKGYVVRCPHRVHLAQSLEQMFRHSSQREADKSNPSNTAESFSHLSVLVVDDKPSNIDLIARYMAHLSITAVLLDDSELALQTLLEKPFDLVILDLYLPGKDGFDIVEVIRSSANPNTDTPIIALTADAYSSTRERAIASGFDQLVTKPVTLTQITDIIRLCSTGNLRTDVSWRLDLAQQSERPTSGAGLDTAASTHGRPVEASESRAVSTRNSLVSAEKIAAEIINDMDWIASALKHYADDVDSYKEQLQNAVSGRNIEALKVSLHSLKGSSDICKITEIAAHCRHMEALCQTPAWQEIELALEKLHTLLATAKTECLEIVAEHRSNDTSTNH